MHEDGGFKDHFSAHAAQYAGARPRYPRELAEWLAGAAPGRALAWDCATGNGQAAVALAEHFERVLATDASAEQLRHAFAHPRVEYRVAPAEAPALDPGSVDLVTVAQAVHWFDRPRFYAAARRASRPHGLVAVWCYGLFRLDPDIDGVIADFYEEIVGPYWPPERHLIDECYRTLDFPFVEIPHPDFQMQQLWTRDDVIGYLRTWSAVQRYRRAEGRDPVESIARDIARLWGAAEQRPVNWPLYLRVGRAS